jgi:hypothetical protein
MQRCQGTTRAGASCRAPAGSGGLCFFHANPESARTLGRIGGRKNRRAPVIDLQVPDNMTATDLRNVTARAIRSLLSGELGTREASALAQLCNSFYRVLPTADLEARLVRLERQLAEQTSGMPTEIDSTPSNTNENDRDGEPELGKEKVARP